jgi:hypothetical protein
MSERKDEKWLDKQLQQVVNGSTPAFDAQAWKQKHRDEYQMLLSRGRASKQSASNAGRTVRVVLGSWIGKLAAAATIAVAVGLFVLGRNGHGPDKPPASPGPMAQSPAELVTVMSLQAAYRQGGTEALDRQFDKALKMLGPRTTSISLKELLGS